MTVEPIQYKSIPLNYLPGYAKFLLDEHLYEFTLDLVRISRAEDIPLLRYFSHFTEEEFVELGTASNREMLYYLSQNNLAGYIERSTNEFIENRLPNLDREEILVEDITLISLVRRKALRNFLPRYTTDIDFFARVMEDVDRFVVATEAASFNAYNRVQQENLKRSETLHKQAQAITHIGNWSWDMMNNTITWSDEMFRIYGLEPQSEQISFERFMSLIHPDDRKKRKKEIEESLLSLQPADYLLRIVNPDGAVKMLKGKSEIITDGAGKPILYNGTCQDVTREYLLNQDLQEKEQNFKQLIHNAPDGIIVINRESIITLWNPKTAEIFGWSAEEVIGKKLTDTIIPPNYHEAHEQGIKRYLRTGEAHVMNKTLELVARNKSQQQFQISLTVSETTQAGEIAFIAFIRDISQQKDTQAELQKKSRLLENKNEELQQINQELESFNFAASHDLQEPLRKMQTYSSRILQKHPNLPLQVTEDLEKIQKASARMQRLMEDLLNFSQNTLRSQETVAVDLNALIEEVKSTFLTNVDDNRVTINIQPLPVVKVVRFQFLQLFLNLLTNAIKYTQPGNAVVIDIFSDIIENSELPFTRSFLADKYLRIGVSDNGIGFDQQYAGKIFDLFTRLHHKDEYSGTGIGLATCKKIIQNHEGFIKAEGTPGKGATFYIYLPEECIVK